MWPHPSRKAFKHVVGLLARRFAHPIVCIPFGFQVHLDATSDKPLESSGTNKQNAVSHHKRNEYSTSGNYLSNQTFSSALVIRVIFALPGSLKNCCYYCRERARWAGGAKLGCWSDAARRRLWPARRWYTLLGGGEPSVPRDATTVRLPSSLCHTALSFTNASKADDMASND